MNQLAHTLPRSRLALASSALICVICFSPSSSQPPKGPLSPREELATFQVARGFKVELVAAEPDVIDPVAMAFDEDGRLFVVEMRGYPNAGVGEGQPNLPGRVKLLEDKDGDGYFEKASIYVDNLRFPTGVCCWRGGILVGNAPDLIYCKDTDGDGKADERRVLYTGFGQKNIQQLLNGLQFHFDNWVHGCNGSNESVIRAAHPSPQPSPQRGEGENKPPPLSPLGRGVGGEGLALRARHFRLNPDVPGSLEPTSGGGQYGLAADDFGQWFTCTNSQHLRHIVLPDHYLRRNPHLAVPAVTHDIPDGFLEHGPAAKVHRISPFEAWRVERTSRRVKDPMGRSFVSTELVPGGYITSATGLAVYRGGVFPMEYNGNVFVCDPANNLIHRDALLPVGPSFIAKRPEEQRDCEFLASTDNWFRPVFLTHGPDGALYLADFYREIIETPLSLPEDIQKQYNLNSRERGRIWRITHESTSAESKANRSPGLSKISDNELVDEVGHANAWRRLTAQRLLIGRKATGQATTLRTLAHTAPSPQIRIHALWTMEGLGVLEAQHLRTSLRDRFWQVREQSLRLSEPHFEKDPQLQALALRMVDDTVPRVRYQLAFSLGQMKPTPEVGSALARLAGKDGVNPWVQSAILSSALPHAGSMLQELGGGSSPPPLVGRLASMLAVGGDERAIAKLLDDLADNKDLGLSQLSVLEGMAQGLARSARPIAKRIEERTPAAERLAELVKLTAGRATDEKVAIVQRLVAVRVLGMTSFERAEATLRVLLTPQSPPELQLAAVQALGRLSDPRAADALLDDWSSHSPAVRREVQEALFARPERIARLLDQVEAGKVLPAHLDLARRQFLLKHPNKDLRTRAEKVLAAHVTDDRRKVLDEHRAALQLPGDPAKGKAVFKKNCTTCHQLENEGFEVGADLLSALKNKTAESLLIDLLDPSREVDPRFLNYVIQAKDGRLLSGVIASETATSIVLRRAEKAEDTLLRADIEQIQSTAKSLMPEGLEKQMSGQELADLLAYLVSVSEKR